MLITSKLHKTSYLAMLLGFIMCLFGSHQAYGQLSSLGRYEILNYSKSDYHAGTQNWDVALDEKDIVYVANNDGMLVYDGLQWELYPTPRKTIMRSLVFDSTSNRMFIGAQGEFGYFDLSVYPLEYTDLTVSLLKDQPEFEDVWNMVLADGSIYFNSKGTAFQYDGKSLKRMNWDMPVEYLGYDGEKLIIHNKQQGLAGVMGGDLQRLDSTVLLDLDIISTQKWQDELYIFSRTQGIFRWDNGSVVPVQTNADDYLKRQQVHSSIISEDGELYIGTYLGGVLVFDENLRLIQVLNADQGLQNNSISAMVEDDNNHLWLASYYGVDHVLQGASDRILYPDGGLKGTMYDIIRWADYYYFASSNGVYRIPYRAYYHPLKDANFVLVSGTEGQTWGFDILNDHLFVGHHNGGFFIDRTGKVGSISNLDIGTWKYLHIDDKQLIAGTYEGICLLTKTRNGWKLIKKYENFKESARIMNQDESGTLWVTHPYKGVFKVNFSSDYQSINVDHIYNERGLENISNCYGHDFNGALVVSNDSSLYGYDYESEKFKLDTQLQVLFQDERFIRLVESNNSRWYISDKTVGKLQEKRQGSGVEVSKESLMSSVDMFVGGFENMLIQDNDKIWICSDRGVKMVDTKKTDNNLKLKYRYLQIMDKKLGLIRRPLSEGASIDLKYGESFSIHFTSNHPNKSKDNVRFSSRMLGLTGIWSPWLAENKLDYSFLPPGDYTLEQRISLNDQVHAKVYKINVKVGPPLWLSEWLIPIYIILGALLVALLIILPRRKLKDEQKVILNEKKKADRKVKYLEDENYQMQLEVKNKELASSTMHLLQKSELMQSIRQDLEVVKGLAIDPSSKKEIGKIISRLNQDERLEEDWENFSTHFDKVHHQFFKRLKSEFPQLTAKDLKMCAYLRLNLSTKEIAPLMGISIRGVEISRYRLRKKLNISGQTHLNDFMINY